MDLFRSSRAQDAKAGFTGSEQAARFCLYTPFVVFILSMCLFPTLEGERAAATTLLVFMAVLLVSACVSGVVALIGMKKHGPRGILVRSLLGIPINGLYLFVITSSFAAAAATRDRLDATYGEAELRAMPGQLEDAEVVIKADKGFRFEVPSGFVRQPESEDGKKVLSRYVRHLPEAPSMAVSMNALGGIIGRAALNQESLVQLKTTLPEGSVLMPTWEIWAGVQIHGYKVRVTQPDGDKTSIWVAHIPKTKSALQLTVAVPREHELEGRTVLREILGTVRARSNWDIVSPDVTQ